MSADIISHLRDKGKQSFYGWWIVAAGFLINAFGVGTFFYGFSTFFNPKLNPAMVYLIEHLKQYHRVVCGTNTIAAHYAHHVEHGDYGGFDVVYASHIMGIAKPRVEFYEHILTSEGVTASQAVFIDDRLENVKAARQINMRAIHFTTYEVLVKDLEAA